MHLSELSYFKNRVDPANRDAFIQRLVKLNERNSTAVLAIVKAAVKERKRLYTALENHVLIEGNTASVLERTMLRIDYARLGETMQQFTNKLFEICTSGSRQPMIAAAWWWLKNDKILGTMRNHDKLRTFMSRVSYASDLEAIVALVNKTAEIRLCGDCGSWEYFTKLGTVWGGNPICRRCQSNRYAWSDYYAQWIHGDDFRRALDRNGDSITIHCNDEDFTYNEDRDEWHHLDYTPPPPPILGNYHSSKSSQYPIVDDWSQSRNRWFGVELEVEIHNHLADRRQKAEQIHAVINGGERGKFAFFEADGSLSNGFEIVTQPMSLPMHQQFWNWLSNKDLTQHLRSHNTGTCGLHVHTNKDDLTKLVQAKIVTFVNDPTNKDLITAVARRYAEGYCKIKNKDLANALATTDRYEAVNVTGRRTIEFRIFKGSLKYESVLAAIEFVNALVRFAKDDPHTTADALKIDNFIEYINNQAADETMTLRPYLNQRLERA